MKKNLTHIVFSRAIVLEVLRYTSLDVISVGSIWVDAAATDADIETFKLNGWLYRNGKE